MVDLVEKAREASLKLEAKEPTIFLPGSIALGLASALVGATCAFETNDKESGALEKQALIEKLEQNIEKQSIPENMAFLEQEKIKTTSERIRATTEKAWAKSTDGIGLVAAGAGAMILRKERKEKNAQVTKNLPSGQER